MNSSNIDTISNAFWCLMTGGLKRISFHVDGAALIFTKNKTTIDLFEEKVDSSQNLIMSFPNYDCGINLSSVLCVFISKLEELEEIKEKLVLLGYRNRGFTIFERHGYNRIIRVEISSGITTASILIPPDMNRATLKWKREESFDEFILGFERDNLNLDEVPYMNRELQDRLVKESI